MQGLESAHQTRRAPRATRRAQELHSLNAIAEALNGTLDLQQALERTLSLAASLLGMHSGWIWLLDRESGQFYNAAVYNLPPYLQAPIQMTGKACWCIEEFQDGELTPKNIGVLECSRLRSAVRAGSVEATGGLRYHASIPLLFQETPLGILNVTGPAWRKLTRTELRLLSTIAYQVGIAIERARLEQEQTRLARAEERARIAREIHDTLAQGLTAIGLHIEGALPYLESDPQRSRERLQQALMTTRESLEEARRSVLDLRTGLPGGKSLGEALAALARALTAETGVRVHLQTVVTILLPLQVEIEIHRIAQEALANVRRHAAARNVTITLRRGARNVSLTVRDDGRGFDPHAVADGHHGIVGMRERAALLGGRLRLESRPGEGTVLRVSVPLAQEGRR
jgi:two-component system NarL family sensor kinase